MTGIIERTTVKGTLNRPTKPNVQISAIIIGTRVAKTWRKLRNMAYKKAKINRSIMVAATEIPAHKFCYRIGSSTFTGHIGFNMRTLVDGFRFGNDPVKDRGSLGHRFNIENHPHYRFIFGNKCFRKFSILTDSIADLILFQRVFPGYQKITSD